MNYVVKYVGKAEKKTETFKQVAVQALNKVNVSRGMRSFVEKFMNMLVAERDWSAQEIHDLILSLSLQKGSRVVQMVDCRHPREQWQADTVTDEAVSRARNLYQKYRERPEHLAHLTYFRFLTSVDFSRQPSQ